MLPKRRIPNPARLINLDCVFCLATQTEEFLSDNGDIPVTNQFFLNGTLEIRTDYFSKIIYGYSWEKDLSLTEKMIPNQKL